MAARGYSNGRDYDENQLNAVQAGPAVPVGEEAKEELADDGAEQGEEVDEETGPLAAVGIVDKGNGGEDDVGGEEVVSAELAVRVDALIWCADMVQQPRVRDERTSRSGSPRPQRPRCASSTNSGRARIAADGGPVRQSLVSRESRAWSSAVNGRRTWTSWAGRAELSEPRKPRFLRRVELGSAGMSYRPGLNSANIGGCRG